MGLFNRRVKEYSLQQAKQLLLTEKYSSYTAVPVDENNINTKYKLVLENVAIEEERQKRMSKKQSEEFMTRIKYKDEMNEMGKRDVSIFTSNREKGTDLYR